MISQKESSTEYNPFVIERNDILDCMTYMNKSDLDLIDHVRENLTYVNEPHVA